MDERELQEIFERLRLITEEVAETSKRGGKVSKETYDEMDKLKKKIKDATESSGKLDKSFNNLGSAAADLGKAMYRGEQGAAVFGDTVEQMAGVISAAILLIPGIGIAAKAATVAVTGLAKAANLAAEQGDTLYNSYVDLAKSGAATAGGLDQVFENIQKFGMGIEQLDQFTQMIANNREQLAKFAPSVGEATEELGEISAAITSTGLRREFMMLGYTVPEINEAMVDYIAIQSQVGRTQNRSNRELTNSSDEYLKTVNALTRATGVQRDQIEENIIAARQDQQFRARMMQLRQSGEDERADAIQTIFGLIGKEFPQAERGLRSLSSGLIQGQDATRLFIQTQGEAFRLTQDLMSGRVDPIQFAEEFTESLSAGAQRNMPLALAGIFDEAMGPFSESADAQFSAITNLEERYNEAMGTIGETTEQQNTLLSSSIDLRISQMEARDALQAMVQSGVAPATAAMDGFAGVTRGVIDMIDAIPFIGREEADQAKDSSFLKGTRVTGRDTADEFSQAGSGISGSAMGTAPEVHDTKTNQVVAGLINEIKGSDGITVRDLFSSPSDPEGNTAIRIVRGIPGLDVDTDLSGAHENHRVISALSQGYLGLLKHDEAPAGRQYREEVAAAIAGELGIDPDKVDSYRTGGISRGPDSGYLSLMHGTEAVVPLPDGKTIPVAFNGLDDMTNAFIDGIQSLSDTMQTTATNSENPEQTRMLNRNLREQLQSVQEQTRRLDSLIQVTQSNNNIMSKILQNSYA